MTTKHIHILGICGTFMGGIAMIAKQMGYHVTGSDTNVYPPMSTFLAENHIEIIPHFEPSQLQPAPDMIIVGNAMKRGNPCIEYMLANNIPYTSGPQWLHDHLLRDRWVLAVSGTHGKTTTTGMLTWILERNDLEPGFLIGGIAGNFGISARLGKSPYFVIEADEYDTAFFDKRSKFVHYRPRIAILNNLEYDHADIFENLQAIETQFHHLVRTMPSEGTIIANAKAPALDRVLARGCWSKLERFDTPFGTPDGWTLAEDGSASLGAEVFGAVKIHMPGRYNELNALAAVAAARAAGVLPQAALKALESFPGVHRRQEVKGEADGCLVIDDFAHHPTAIHETIDGVRGRWPGRRLLAVLEPRSNTMKLGTMKDRLAGALADADAVFCYAGPGVAWSPEEALKALGSHAWATHDFDALVTQVVNAARPGDVILCMSNGGFGGIHGKLLAGLKAKAESRAGA